MYNELIKRKLPGRGEGERRRTERRKEEGGGQNVSKSQPDRFPRVIVGHQVRIKELDELLVENTNL
eukprot:747775-Hanusia_phi.AAC.1